MTENINDNPNDQVPEDESLPTDPPEQETDALSGDDTLVIEFDDLPETPAPEPEQEDTLVIELGPEDEEKPTAPPPGSLDLTGFDFSSEPEPPPVAGPTPHMPSQAPSGKSGVSGLEAFSFQGVLAMAIAGLLGGLFGWALSEPVQIWLRSSRNTMDVIQTAAGVGAYAAVVGAAIGIMLGLANGYNVGFTKRTSNWAVMGMVFGAVGGFVGGGIAQFVYGTVTLNYSLGPVGSTLIRAVGWSFMGVFFGLGQGAVVTAARKMRNGILGGALGGLIGGVILELIIRSGPSSAVVGRVIALCAMGLAIGALIGLVEEVAKEAWIRITDGPLTGKQFILYESRTTIGADPSCSIVLFKDPAVAPYHAEIAIEQSDYVVTNLDRNARTMVNGREITSHHLRDGDEITIGRTVLEFHEREHSANR